MQARGVFDVLKLELSRDDLTLIDTSENRCIDEKACRGLNHLDPARHNLLIKDGDVSIAVSYTHLTLPTNREV